METGCISWLAGKIVLTLERTCREFFSVMNLNRFQCELQLKWLNLASPVLFLSSMFPPHFLCQHQQCCGDIGIWISSAIQLKIVLVESSLSSSLHVCMCFVLMQGEQGQGCVVRSSERRGLSIPALAWTQIHKLHLKQSVETVCSGCVFGTYSPITAYVQIISPKIIMSLDIKNQCTSSLYVTSRWEPS